MSIKTYLSVISWLLLCYTTTFAAKLQLQSRRLSVKDGMTSNTVNSIAQDRDGYIWFATTNGFCRYDGYSFVNFTQFNVGKQHVHASNISLLLNDNKNGLVWGYTPQQTNYCFDINKGKFVDYTNTGEINKPFWNKCLTTNGIWLYTNEFGARHVTYNKGVFSVKDYTLENGLLQSNFGINIKEDCKNSIWIASQKGLLHIDKNEKKKVILKGKNIIVSTLDDQYYAVLAKDGEAFVFDLKGHMVRHSRLSSAIGAVNHSRSSMFWDNKWYIFTDKETYAMDMNTGLFYKPQLQIPDAIDKNPLRSYTCVYDKKGNIWFFKKNGWMRKLHLMDNPAYVFGRDKNFSVAEDQNGRLFIASYGNGLFIYDPQNDELQHFSKSDPDPLFDTDLLLSIYIDRSHCIWVSSGYGVYRIHEINTFKSQYVKVCANETNEWDNFVRHISYVDANHIIATTKSNKIYLYDINSMKAKELMSTDACAYFYKKDAEGQLWIGTKGAGMTVNNQRYTKKDETYNIPSNSLFDMEFDKLGRAWIATWGEGLLLTKKKGNQPLKFKSYFFGNNKSAQIHDLFMDRKYRLWASTNDGIYMVDTHKTNPTEKDFIHFNTTNGKLPVDQIICGLEAQDGTLWFGTSTGVLKCSFNENKNKLEYNLLTTSNGLINNTVRSMQEDLLGHIWVTTEEGLSRISKKSLKTKSFLLNNHITENAFAENSVVRLADGRLVFGLESGLLVLTPEKDQPIDLRHQDKVTITNLTINGISIFNDEMDGVLESALNHTKSITLPSDKNSLSIYYSNFNYAEDGSTIYQYYLEGINKNWLPATSINHADYNNLQPGTYTLHLRALDEDNHWSQETTFKISIRHPWYNTWIAWFIYISLFVGITWFMYRQWRKNFNLSQAMKLEKQMVDFRIDFFTHISHEFRTPLAIIQSAVEKLQSSEEATVSKRTLLTINRGTKRMQRLINQLMEFRKISTGNMKLSVEDGDFISFIRTIYNDIYLVAKQKDINISYTPWINKFQMPFDQQKIETIVYNLLSNAVKYTPSKGTIAVKIMQKDDFIVLSIEDSGPGISPQREKELFKPFMHGYVSKGGMGIGLYTAHNMAHLHKGDLTYARSTVLGGSLFTLTLPKMKEQYAPSDFVEKTAIEKNSIEQIDIEKVVKEMTPKAINDITVMIIEDDIDMMEQLKSELAVYFHVVAYMNGKIAYENIKKVKPSLIISDIMLPDMSGYEIVSAIKADPETQDIPVIMLTAYDDANHILKAYRSFADDYMVKPCNFKILIARALQFVAMDIKLKSRIAKNISNEQKLDTSTTLESNTQQEASIVMSPLDKKFKDKVEAIVAQHLGDNNFNVDKLAELLNIGRTTAYNRIKNIMGISPNIYIQNERLRIAAELLLEGKYSVTQVSDKVGFSDATYFYKCFKHKYGVAPSKYGK